MSYFENPFCSTETRPLFDSSKKIKSVYSLCQSEKKHNFKCVGNEIAHGSW